MNKQSTLIASLVCLGVIGLLSYVAWRSVPNLIGVPNRASHSAADRAVSPLSEHQAMKPESQENLLARLKRGVEENLANERAGLEKRKSDSNLSEKDAPAFCRSGNRCRQFAEGCGYGNVAYYPIAIEWYSLAIRVNQSYADAYNGRGLTYYGMKEYAKAEEDFKRSIEAGPDNANAYYNLGALYTKLGDRKRATVAMSNAQNNDPLFYYIERDYSGCSKLAMEWRQRDQDEKAIYYLTKAIAMDPHQEINTLYYDRGYIYYDQKEYVKAIDDFTRQIEVKHGIGCSIFYNKRGWAYRELGMNDKADADFRKAEELQ